MMSARRQDGLEMARVSVLSIIPATRSAPTVDLSQLDAGAVKTPL